MTAVHLSAAAQSVVEETGVRPQDDVEALICMRQSPAGLLELCLRGVEDAGRRDAWIEYVQAVVRVAHPELASDLRAELDAAIVEARQA